MSRDKDFILRLSKAAAKELEIIQQGRLFPQDLEAYSLARSAFGESKIEEDFITWLRELKALRLAPAYPVSDYLKVMESRLQSADNKQLQRKKIAREQKEETQAEEINRLAREKAQEEIEKEKARIAQEERDIEISKANPAAF